jgi:hypothetical protein
MSRVPRLKGATTARELSRYASGMPDVRAEINPHDDGDIDSWRKKRHSKITP